MDLHSFFPIVHAVNITVETLKPDFREEIL